MTEVDTNLQVPEPSQGSAEAPTSSRLHPGEIADSQSEGEDEFGSDEDFDLDEPELGQRQAPQASYKASYK